jgi:hypothetical protein
MSTSRLLTSTLGTAAATLAATAVLALAPVAPSASADSVIALPSLAGSSTAASATAHARDGRLAAGCEDYPVRYAVRDAGDDWMLDLVVRDRSGDEVASASLQAVEHGARGWTTVTFCREAVRAGTFSISGVLTERDGYEQVEHPVERSTFRLTR